MAALRLMPGAMCLSCAYTTWHTRKTRSMWKVFACTSRLCGPRHGLPFPHISSASFLSVPIIYAAPDTRASPSFLIMQRLTEQRENGPSLAIALQRKYYRNVHRRHLISRNPYFFHAQFKLLCIIHVSVFASSVRLQIPLLLIPYHSF